MIITFCGHSQFNKTDENKKKVLDFLHEKIGDNPADMYLGGYGDFDSFAHECCKELKQSHPNVTLVFVTPYFSEGYQKNHLKLLQSHYDTIVFPDIENKPLKFAICYRNRYMVDKADYVIAYIDHDWGGAYTTYKYAKRKGKEIFNLADFE